MTPERWHRVTTVFHAARTREAADRDVFLTEACRDDVSLRQAVEAMLAGDKEAGSFGERPLFASRPSLESGTYLGAYRIERLIGRGGMGDVYCARDVKLGRDVAIKVLPAAWLADPGWLERFQREARVLAALNHPNIATIHGNVEGMDGAYGLVLELVDGPTLAERTARGPVPLAEALPIAQQISEALQAAHQRGIVHRDVKPANIKFTRDGHVKVLDFGLAREVGGDAEADAPAVAGMPSVSRESLPVGTPAYMSPEQAQGHPVDERTDVWAFGCVLYEMLTSMRAFSGNDLTETIAAVLHDPIDWDRLPADTPAPVRHLLRRCLERDRSARLPDITMALREIHDARAGLVARVDGPDKRPIRSLMTRRLGWSVGVVLLLGIVIVGRAVARYGYATSSTGALPLVLGNANQLTADDGIEIEPSISHDGRFVAYSGGTPTKLQIFVRSLTGSAVARLSDQPSTPELQPRWSPDDSQILYLTLEGAFVKPVTGGPAHQLGAHLAGGSHATASLFASITPSGITGATWAPNGKHVAIAIAGGLVDVSVDGDHSVRLASAKDELHACDWSANGKWIACASGNWNFGGPGGYYGNLAPSSIVLVPGRGGEPREITDRTTTNASPIWSHNGRFLYFLSNRQGTSDVYAVKITEDGRVEGTPVRITTGLEASSIALSPDGKHLFYAASYSRANIWSVRIPSGGSVDADNARPVTSGTQIIESMSVSRDGKWLVYDSNLQGRGDIYRVPTAGGATERLTTDATGNFQPMLSADGQWLSYHSWRTGSRDIFVQRLADGRAEQVTGTPSQECCPHWLPDNRTILFLDQFVENGVSRGTYLVRRGESGRWSTPIALPKGVAGNGSWSSDGRLYAYSRWEFAPPTKGTIELFSIDSGEQRVIYAPHLPDDPVAELVLFSENDKTLYFKSHDPKGHASIWSIPTFGGRPSVLVRFEDLSRPSSRWDFAAGAGHFYFTLEDRQSDLWMADVTEH